MAWLKMKKMLISDEDIPEIILPAHRKTPSPSVGSHGTFIEEIKAPCRTPMGEYIIPEGGKPLTSLGLSYPGPADYLPHAESTKSAAPQYSIVGRPRRIDEKRHIPGPFEYHCGGDIIWKDKTISMKGRSKCFVDKEAQKSISKLGKYKVEYKSVGSEGPKFKIGTKHNANSWPVRQADSHGFQTPGPNYRPNSSYWGRGQQKSFGNNWSARQQDGPGPADYDICNENNGPSHSFGMKLPEPVSVLQKVNKFSPAANTYDIGTTIGKAPAISISGRDKEPAESKKGPCPATYYPVRSSYDKYKAKALTYKRFEPNEPSMPGPADYKVKHVNLKKSPQYTCRQRTKHTYPDSVTYAKSETEGPGPGTYQTVTSFIKNDNPAYSFRKRVHEKTETENVPGPNVYYAEDCEKPESSRAPAFSMAKRLQQPNSMKDTPGPGEYTPKLKQSAPKYTMTRRAQHKGTFVNPAPNNYTLPEAISGKNKGVILKSRASPYIYSGFRTNKLAEPTVLTEVNT